MDNTRNPTAAAFWAWFLRNESTLRRLLESDSAALAALVSAEVERITRVDWEIGPGRPPAEFAFAFGPSDTEELDEAEKLIDGAATPNGWELLPHRRPKDPLPRVRLRFRGEYYDLPLDDWSYTLTSFDDERFFDVDVFPGGARGPKGMLEKAVRVVVQLLLGDLAYIRLIDRIRVAAASDANSTPIRALRDHVAHILNPALSSILVTR